MEGTIEQIRYNLSFIFELRANVFRNNEYIFNLNDNVQLIFSNGKVYYLYDGIKEVPLEKMNLNELQFIEDIRLKIFLSIINYQLENEC